jgi:hypothetical protein
VRNESAYASIRQHTSAYAKKWGGGALEVRKQRVSIRQHTSTSSAYASMRYVSICQHTWKCVRNERSKESMLAMASVGSVSLIEPIALQSDGASSGKSE